MSRGLVYVATGGEYIEKAVASARSAKKHNPGISTTLLTNDTINVDVFDKVINNGKILLEKGDSILGQEHIIYDRNIYIDADTYIASDITDVFDILDRFDIAASQNEARSWYHESVYDKHDIEIPESFPEYNTGIMAYTDSPKVRSLFKRWNSLYRDIGYERNQPAFRLALYESNVSLGTLPPEYNFMTHTIGFASGEVKILHEGTSNENLAEWASRLNSISGKKVTTWEKAPVRVVPNSHKNWRYKLGKFDRESITSLYHAAKAIRRDDGNLALVKAITDRLI